MKKTLKTAFLVALLGLPVQLRAVPTTVFVNSSGAGSQNNYVLGMDFVVNNAVTVTAMGAFDDNGDGFTAGHTISVGIYALSGLSGPSDTGTLISASFMTFDNATPGTLDGGSRFKSVTPFTLAPGNYSIVAAGFDLDKNGNTGIGGVTSFNDLGGDLSLVAHGGRWNNGDAFTFPTVNYDGYSQSDPVFQAGTFQVAVPDGGVTIALLGFTLVGIESLRRKLQA